MKKVDLPLHDKDIKALKAGDEVLLNGFVYTARDAAHLNLSKLIRKNKRLPFEINGATIYYTGPTPPRKGRAIGSCGPTTSGRMDRFTPLFLSKGLKGMIGKGRRDKAVRDAIRRYKAVYFIAVGGAGALLSEKVKSAKVIAFPELGPEAVYKLGIKDFPVIVGVDSSGRDVYGRI
ncbi:MAG: fumarate hydratase [Candidatus Omnitrophica bacterium CG1_02_49_10]|nr:MAG: fumarate hydratase [Candidatus Omnitrophica bacterium CG1_02_49_10]